MFICDIWVWTEWLLIITDYPCMKTELSPTTHTWGSTNGFLSLSSCHAKAFKSKTVAFQIPGELQSITREI